MDEQGRSEYAYLKDDLGRKLGRAAIEKMRSVYLLSTIPIIRRPSRLSILILCLNSHRPPANGVEHLGESPAAIANLNNGKMCYK